MRLLCYFTLFFTLVINAQIPKTIIEDISISKYVDGTLLRPDIETPVPLIIIIPDSGPTDRNGNQNFLKNNSLKKLSESLVAENIATFRMDKRIVKEMRKGRINLKVSIEDFVKDTKEVITFFKLNNVFNKIYILGHGQGSLVGMLSVNDDVSGFISIGGAGTSLDLMLIQEVEKTAPTLVNDTKRILNSLKQGKTTRDYPLPLSSLFDYEIQPFMMSWINHNPSEIIKKIIQPILIINGTKDLQVSINEATELEKCAQDAQLRIIDDMNHVMFLIEGDDLENSKSYNESFRSISVDLINSIVDYIKIN